jgi:hypothetical protein
MAAVSIATFHVEINRDGGGPHPNANLKSEQYLDMVDMLFMSAQQFHPESKCIVLTDETTRLGAVSSYCSRMNYAVRHDKIMLDRMGAQRAFIKEYDFSRPLVLADSDVLINNSLDSVFQQDFDVGLTWRDNSEMPINGGIILVNNRRRDASRRFFTVMHEIYESKYADRAEWYGDQYAIRDFIGMTVEEIASHHGMVEAQGCRILLLPCEQYNYSPKNAVTSIASRFPDKYVLHFKGERKPLMKLYWQAHLLSLKSWNPFVWLCARRARRAICEGVSSEQGGRLSIS